MVEEGSIRRSSVGKKVERHGKWSITRYCPVCHASGWPHLHKHDVVRGQKFQLGYFAREWRARIDFPRAPRQHRKTENTTGYSGGIKAYILAGAHSGFLCGSVEFPRVSHVYPHAFCFFFFFWFYFFCGWMQRRDFQSFFLFFVEIESIVLVR